MAWGRTIIDSHSSQDLLHASVLEVQADCRPLVLAVLNQGSNEEAKRAASREVAGNLQRRLGGRLAGGDIEIVNPIDQTVRFADGEAASWGVLVNVYWVDGAKYVTWSVQER